VGHIDLAPVSRVGQVGNGEIAGQLRCGEKGVL